MRARWSKSCVLIGYPSGEDGPIFFLFVCLFFFYYYFICGPVLPVQDFLLWSCKKKSAFWPYNKSFIDQASLVMMLDIALILFGIFIYLDFISVHKNAMGNGQYPALLIARLVNNAYHSIHSLNLSLPCFNFQSHQNQPSFVSYPVWEFFSPHVWSWYGWTTKNNKNNQKNDFTNLR